MTRHRGGGPVQWYLALAGLCALPQAACQQAPAGGAPQADESLSGRQATDLEEARQHLAEGRSVHAQLALRRVLEEGDSGEARALWWAATRATQATRGQGGGAAARPPHPAASRVCVLPGGEAAVTGHVDGTLRLWNLSSGDATPLLGGASGPVEALACGPDGTVAAAGGGSEILLWDAPSSGPVVRPRRLDTGGPTVRQLAFHPALGVLAAALSDATIGHWSPRTGQELARIRGHRGRLPGLAFSKDGRQLATWGDERGLRVRRWGQDDLPQRLNGHRGRIRTAAFLPGGGALGGAALVSADDEGQLLLWDVRSELLRPTSVRIGKHAGETWAIAVHPDGTRVATADSDGHVRLWPVSGDGPPQRLAGHLGPVRDVAFTSDGARLVSVGLARGVRIWDGRTGAPLLGPATQRSTMELAGDERVECTLSWPGILELKPPGVRRRIKDARSVVATPGGCAVLSAEQGALVLKPNGELESVDPAATAIAWSSSTGRLLTSVKRHDDHPGRVTAIASAGIYGLATGEIVLPDGRTLHLSARPSKVTQLAPLPANTLAATFAGGQLSVWHVPTARRLTEQALNGRPTQLRTDAAQTALRATTDLGDRTSLDVTALSAPWCTLLETVWSAVPSPAPPASHRCRPPA